MNTGSTFTTAIIRGLYVAIVTGLIAGLTVYQQTDDEKEAAIVGILAALGALGVRGGLEGFYDSTRQAAGDVKASDVQPTNAGGV
jgi:small basic protein